LKSIDFIEKVKKYYKPALTQTLPLHRYFRTKRFVRDVHSNIQWIASPALQASKDDMVVLCVVRNGADYLPGFVEHHLSLGARHLVFLDNGSTDRTADLARSFGEQVTVVRCDLTFSQYMTSMKLWLSKEFGKGCWCLIADIDERFDFPFSDRITLVDFLRYLNSYNYSGVLTPMIDLFADGPMSTWPASPNVERECIWFDHSNLQSLPMEPISQWLAGNRYASKELKLLIGGIRKEFFHVGRPMTKQSLLFPSRGAVPITPHWTIRASFADVSAALLHYPFNKDFYKRCVEIVQRNSHWKNSGEYRIYLSKLTEAGEQFTFKKPTSKRFENVNQLIADGHLVVSKNYLDYVEGLQKNGRV
jgi:glycosyltransferase involved in cell wall biosynthesis